jgi:hypothetical protein
MGVFLRTEILPQEKGNLQEKFSLGEKKLGQEHIRREGKAGRVRILLPQTLLNIQ